MKKSSFKFVSIILILSFICIMVINNSNATEKVVQSKAEELPSVGTLENFKKIVKESQKFSQVYGGIQVQFTEAMPAAKAAVDAQSNGAAAPSAGSGARSSSTGDYSKTNVQVDGVDESDIVKTDGTYIYQVNNRKVVISKAYPAESMKIASSIEFTDKAFHPSEIYVDSNILVVIGSSYNEIKYEVPQNPGVNEKRILPRYPNPGRSIVKVIVYDIKDRENVKELRQAEIEGDYLSSRKIGSKLYIVSNKYVDYYILEQGNGDITPSYRDSKVSNEFRNIGYDQIKYFPDTLCSSYMVIGSIDVASDKEMKVETYLGSGQNIYVSNENLYVAVTKYDPKQTQEVKPDTNGGVSPSMVYPMPVQNTLIYKFSLNNGNVVYSTKGEVPGTILNQFSMDEFNKHFRIATTTGQAWRGNAEPSKNNIYILDSTMNTSGKIENIAPGERIYSVRFMGEKGYLVTFETVDPLFVVDLKDPKNPKILGALKIPGYSNYLHPYDQNHIIGFGKDAIVLPVKDGKGNAVREQAYYMGMKIAIFNVTDVNNPIEKHSIKIGDRGTESEVLHNHRALLFSKEKNLMAFPVSLFELKDGQSPINSQYNHPEYGTFTFQGAYIYNIDLQKGFTLKGRISHMDNEDYLKSGKYYNGQYKTVERILYISDTLYTLSKDKIKALDMANLSSKGEVRIPQSTNQ